MIEGKDILKKNILFRGLTDDEIDRMINYLNGKVVQIPKGNILKNEGDMMENICVVLSGDIYAQRVDENGVNCIIQIFNPGDSFGEMNAIGGYPMNVSLMAKDDSSVLCFPQEAYFATKSMYRLLPQRYFTIYPSCWPVRHIICPTS